MEKSHKYQGWTLFLDRDGVINRRTPGDYIRNWSGFFFLEGVPEAIAKCNTIFDRVLVVTNQQGIGKGLMSEADLVDIHQRMIQKLNEQDAQIHKAYYCPHLKTENCVCRKPRVGMAMQAKVDFPAIQFHQSIMVGDSLTDIQFGCRLGMETVWIDTKEEDQAAISKALSDDPAFYITYRCTSLKEFVASLCQK